MTVFATLLFGTYLFDIGAIPVLFSKALVEELVDLPYDFSIETYVYWVAKKNGYKIVRRDVDMKNRVGGKSSWNHGLKSKIKQSKRIMQDLIKIKQGRSVR